MISSKRRKIENDCLNTKESESNNSKSTLYPILPDELTEDIPLVEVYVDEITDPKHISKVVVDINSSVHISDLLHLKRIRSHSVLLFPKTACEITDVYEYLTEKKIDISFLANKVQVALVAQVPPKTRSQYEKVNKLWPCNFHIDKYIENLVSNNVFNQTEIKYHKICMQVAIDVAKAAEKDYKSRKIGAVVFDPKISSVVSIGYDLAHYNPCKHTVMVAIDNVAVYSEWWCLG